ncbi:hypothetical protein [Clostridium sp. E02]|uniref:hypothetical protein n=1 Tax=Clostridium sp. E02 TaxID=2487134 RepID=UPI000F525542|nr:hypothetical protein [Clostridium sp. E02]
MNGLIKKIGILSAVFLIAIAVYFMWNQRIMEKDDTMVYTSMDDAALPVVSVDMFGKTMNVLHGYKQDMKQTVSREAITVLPSDRALPIQISEYQGTITGIRYEIRSLDLDRLVERTDIKDWTKGEDGIHATLPIQNLLAKDRKYLLILTLDTPDNGNLFYYTQITWTDQSNAGDMIDFALDFTKKTFDYEQAKQLTTYLETSTTEDNSSLGHVTIRSSFSQLTWAGLPVEPVGEIKATLKDLDGIMCNVNLEYEIKRVSENGTAEFYEVEDNYTMKWNSRRIYLMDFERNTNQIFSGNKSLFSGKRILLGITNPDEIQTAKSSDKNWVAYAVNRDLWTFDQKKKHGIKIFSFRSGEDNGLRSGYNQHDIKILSVKDNGDVDFLVYGYMNRGIHEGCMGIAMYQYSIEDNAIKERFFTPVTLSFEQLKEEVGQLSHLGENGMLYLMANRSVYGIDLNSNEYMVLADSLSEGGYAVSSTQRHFAWQEGSDVYGASGIHLMDLDDGRKKEITGEEENRYRPLGFVGDDFVYGIAKEGDIWVQNGRVKDAPMVQIQIMDQSGKIVKKYEQPGTYIADVSVEDSRIHLTQVVRPSPQIYADSKQDTIVCNQELLDEDLQGIGWYASEDRRKLYFVQLKQEIDSKNVKISVPKKVAYETTEVVELKGNKRRKDNRFYAYGGGHYLGSSQKFTDAMELAYEKMGVVTDHNQQIVWDRVNRPPVKTMKEPLKTGAAFVHGLQGFKESGDTREGVLMIDARDSTLNQILSFIGQGCPVAAYTGEGSYVLLSGYDQYNVTLYDPETREVRKMGLNDATAYFTGLGNDFVCGVIRE